MATEKKAAPKKATTVKRDPNLCHFGGPRKSYGATSTAVCNKPKVAGRELCADHEAKWKVVAKARAAAKKPATPKAPKSAGTSPKTTGDPMAREIAATKAMKAKRTPKNSGGQVRASTPPAPPRVPVARVNAPEQAPHLVQLVAAE